MTKLRFYRAGHAHAGVLVTLGMLITIFVDLAGNGGLAQALSRGVLVGAILMPAGFFLSVAGSNPSRRNGLIALVWAGAASVTVGVLGAGLGALVALRGEAGALTLGGWGLRAVTTWPKTTRVSGPTTLQEPTNLP